MKRTLAIKNDIGQLTYLNDFLQQFASEAKLDQPACMNFRLAIEEAVVNVISYAYPGEKDKEITISAEYDAQKIKVEITDSGIAFDPTSKQTPDTSLPLEERPVGGLGIFLVKQLMTEVTYCRSGNKNILTMIKDLDKPWRILT